MKIEMVVPELPTATDKKIYNGLLKHMGVIPQKKKVTRIKIAPHKKHPKPINKHI